MLSQPRVCRCRGRDHFRRTGGIAKSSGLLYKRAHFASQGAALGDPGGSQLTAKTGNDEVNGDRGAHKEPKTKREEAEEEKRGPQKHPRGVTTIDPGPPLGGNVGFITVKLMFLLFPFRVSNVLLGGSWGTFGGQWLPRRFLGDPWGGSRAPFGRPWGDRRAPVDATFGNRRQCKIIVLIL